LSRILGHEKRAVNALGFCGAVSQTPAAACVINTGRAIGIGVAGCCKCHGVVRKKGKKKKKKKKEGATA